jgi:hypothetical protein
MWIYTATNIGCVLSLGVKGSKSKKLGKKIAYYLLWKIHKLLFFIVEMNFWKIKYLFGTWVPNLKVPTMVLAIIHNIA